MSLNLLFLDFETQSADAKNTNITEIGAHFVKGSLTQDFSTLVYDHDYPPQTPEIVDLTGITDGDLKREGKSPKEALNDLLMIFKSADLIIAHNTSFDRTVVESTAKRVGLDWPEKEWLCTYSEFPWPEKYTCKKLSHLALDHGVPMDKRKLHRALDDVILLRDLLKLYSLEDVLKYKRSPWVYLKAIISKPWIDGGVQKDQASKMGFGWERCRGTSEPLFEKQWVKRVKEGQVDAERTRCPFPIVVLDTAIKEIE
jgi:DNA polymerase III epsilon subunit-like protein